MKKKKIQKGQYGYIKKEKVRRLLLVIGLFLLPLSAFIGGVIVTGTKANIITVVALVGCLPACRALVNAIMMWIQKPMEKEIYEKIEAKKGTLEVFYEMYLTSYEKSFFIDSFAVCGNKIAGYSSRIQGSTQFMEQHVRKILKQNGYKTDVKIYTDLNVYLERLEYLNHHQEELTKDIAFTPDERYPKLSREELIKHLILSISL